MILFHIVFSTLPFLQTNLILGLKFLVDLSNPLIITGQISLAFISLGIVFAYLRSLKRPHWIGLHRIFLLALPFIAVHFWLGTPIFLISEIITSIFLFITIILLALQYLYPRSLCTIVYYEVINTRTLNSSTIEITIVPTTSHSHIAFYPGQFIYLSVDCTHGCGVSHEFHPFTLYSSPTDKNISIAVRGTGDDGKKLLHIKTGNRAKVEGPYGSLLTDFNPKSPQLWIAGGIGITPFVSYARYWRGVINNLDVTLIILVANNEDNIFEKEFADIPGIKIIVHNDQRDGFPNINRLVPKDWKTREVAISGPPVMVKTFKRILKKQGAKNIRTEEFEI